MEKILILTPAQANAIKGKHGIYSEIDPITIPDGNYMIPEKCISDPDLISIKETILSMNANTQELDKIPDVGEQVYAGQLYEYYPSEINFDTFQSNIVIAIQDHVRVNYPPEETPAVFPFFRKNADDLEWIPNEKVYEGWKRVYEGLTYTVIQEHMTQTDWPPNLVIGTLWELDKSDAELEVLPWVQPTGAHDAYNIGDQVIFENAVWESVINANTWSPSTYPVGWNKLYDL